MVTGGYQQVNEAQKSEPIRKGLLKHQENKVESKIKLSPHMRSYENSDNLMSGNYQKSNNITDKVRNFYMNISMFELLIHSV